MPLSPLFYDVVTTTMKALLLFLTRWEVRRRENVPPMGSLIIVSNHLSLIDPPLLSASIPRRISFMAKEELVYSRRGGVFVRAYGGFPVRRGRLDREAIRQAQRMLVQGVALGMFPEGTRSLTFQMQPAHPGTSLIAIESGAAILPVGITGSERIKDFFSVFLSPQITVTIGRPFNLPPIEGRLTSTRLIQITDFIMKRVAELLPQSYRGVYGVGSTGELSEAAPAEVVIENEG